GAAIGSLYFYRPTMTRELNVRVLGPSVTQLKSQCVKGPTNFTRILVSSGLRFFHVLNLRIIIVYMQC
ncbi:hypothetical protein L9F63_015103, partial [Diploptera punctata]